VSSTTPEVADKLPIWRFIAGILVLLGMAGVLLALAPVYYEDYRLREYVRSLVRGANAPTTSDEALRASVMNRAHELDLPVQQSDVVVSHDAGKLHLELKYVVQMDFPLYQVDLHFHPGATSP
jgi:hypothetical protein